MNKRIIVVPILLFSMIISSCSNKINASENESSLTPEEISYFTKLKEDYYQQRFLDAGTNIYDARKALGQEGNTEPYHFTQDVTVDSIGDLRVYILHYLYENMCIASFTYKGMGDLKGAWFEPSRSTITIQEDMRQIDFVFDGNIYAPEIYYQGSFYYIKDAFKIGILTLDNPNIVIVEKKTIVENEKAIEYIRATMPGTKIDF